MTIAAVPDSGAQAVSRGAEAPGQGFYTDTLDLTMPEDSLGRSTMNSSQASAGDTSVRTDAVKGGKLADNTGSSYFNAEVPANLNDQMRSVYNTRLLYDSVTSASNKDFVYNTLTVNNTTGSRIAVQVIITGPQGWQMVTANTVNLELEPFGSSIIPMRFMPSGSNTAGWQQVRIEYRLNNVVDTRKTFFRIRVQEYSGFKATLPNSAMVMTGYQKQNSFPVFVKNSGNTEGHYIISAVNQLLKLNAQLELYLGPGLDTTLYLPLIISESQYSMLRKEEIRVAVANDQKEVINLIQTLSKVGYLLKDHASAYLDMPLQFEAGLMYQGAGSPVQYYGALFGTLELSEQDHLSMSLRSNTIAQGQTNNNSLLRLDYTGKQLSASLGNIQTAGEFMIDGYGGRLGYQWGDQNKAEVFAMLRSRTGNTKAGGAALQLKLGDRMSIYDALTLSLDQVRRMNAGIISQITEYRFSTGKISLITGVGAEKNDGQIAEGTQTSAMGTSLGYNLVWSTKRLAALSNVLYNSNSYPGTFKGQRIQMHDLRWLMGKHFAGAYYEYNYRKQSLWQDTLFLENIFSGSTTNYGVKAGLSFRKASVTLGLGRQQQLQEGVGSHQTNYDYLNLNLSTMPLKGLFINISSFGGYMSVLDGKKQRKFVATAQGHMQYKGFGASFRYDHGPYYYQEFLSYLQKPAEYRRIIFSPYGELRLFKKTLTARIQANFASTLPADVSNTSLLANVSYSTRDYDFNINGIVPVGGSSGNQPYVNAAFRMRIKAPFVAIRKYYNLSLVLFKDSNSNGIKDPGEEPVAGQTLSLNGDLFVSDGKGMVIYKNTETGMYKCDFGYSSKLKGWIPNAGTIQHFEISGNRQIMVPYKVSRVLSGKLIVEKDSFSNAGFNPGNIKVTATGEKGEVYSTLTDAEGGFYFNLPSGAYVVTLSELAFGDQFRPVSMSQPADLVSNMNKSVYFEIRQKRRQINIRRK